MTRIARNLLLLSALGLLALSGHALAADRVPLSSGSQEAKDLYLKARGLTEALRFTDAHQLFVQSAEKDPQFALAHLGVAQTSSTGKEFFETLQRAVALAPGASEAERLLILAFDAGVKSMPAEQKKDYEALAGLYPDDERVQTLLGNYYFGVQDYDQALDHLEKAVRINPDYSAPYNMLGYSYRYKTQYPKAEGAFRKYIELVPGEPNPYDSYGEFLMKVGRFEESIQSYQKALATDPNFIPSFIGISTNQVLLGKGEEARTTCDRFAAAARNVGEKRQALFWKSITYIHEKRHDDAISVIRQMDALAEKDQDLSTMAGDFTMIGNVLLDAGQADSALSYYRRSLETAGRAEVPTEVKDAARRNFLYEQGRLAVARHDLEGARAKSAEYSKAVAAQGVSFEIRQAHELAGRVALEEKKHTIAIAELKQANQQDPSVLYLMAIAYEGAGDRPNAITSCDLAANYNGLNNNYAYVRKPALEMLARLRK